MDRVDLVRDVETRVLGKPAGVQDYYPPLGGGLHTIRFEAGRTVARRTSIDPSGWERHMTLFDTGAALQFGSRGRIVSGGSTITMQLARLMEPRRERSVSAKLRQIVRALQIERQLDKNRRSTGENLGRITISSDAIAQMTLASINAVWR